MSDSDRLDLPGCPSPCLYSEFISLVEPYQMDFTQWSQECILTSSDVVTEQRSMIVSKLLKLKEIINYT